MVPRDPSFPRDSVPSYITEKVSLASFILDKQCFPLSEEVCFKVFDFGRGKSITCSHVILQVYSQPGFILACYADTTARELPGAAPPTIRPPEVHMHSLSGGRIGSVWSREADIWAIGSIVSHFIELCIKHGMYVNPIGQAYQIKTGCQLFLVQGDLQYQLYQALRLGGAPPEDWSKFWDLEKFCESTKGRRKPVLPVFNKDEAWESRRPRNDPESEVFLHFIRKMVITEPERRSQIAELLRHPFLS